MLFPFASLQGALRAQGMAYRQRQRVGGIGGLRQRVQPQHLGHHAFDLYLLGLAVAP